MRMNLFYSKDDTGISKQYYRENKKKLIAEPEAYIVGCHVQSTFIHTFGGIGAI